MTAQIFDRDVERRALNTLLHETHATNVTVLGESGVGKSAILSRCLIDANLPTLSFSFKTAAPDNAAPFRSFLIALNRKYGASILEKFTNLRPKDLKIGTSYFAITLDILPAAIDQNFIQHLFERAYRDGFRVLRIENIELCKDAIDIDLLIMLSNLTESHLKLAFEIGTLGELDGRLLSLTTKNGHREILTVYPLDRAKSIGLYRFLHDSEPPPDIYDRSCGLPLAIEHRSRVEGIDDRLSWIKAKLDSLSPGLFHLAYTLSAVEEPCIFSELNAIYLKDDFEQSLINLIRLRIVQDTKDGIRFSHPSFRVALRRNRSPNIDRVVYRNIYLHRIHNRNGSLESEMGLVSISVQIGDAHQILLHAFTAIGIAYRLQNAMSVAFLCNILIDTNILTRRQQKIIEFIKIQSLCQLSRVQDAEACLTSFENVFDVDPRTQLLRAIIYCQKNDRTKSNSVIDEILFKLDNRSAAIALALKVTNDIPLQQRDSAREAFEEAIAIASLNDMPDIHEELIRLEGKLAPEPELAIERMRDQLAAPVGDQLGEISRARLIHNLGVQEMLISDCSMGMERLVQARTTFEKHGSNYAAYSAVSQSVFEIGSGRLNNAIDILIDAQCLCREQYDHFGILNNLGAAYLLKGNIERALSSFETSGATLQQAEHALNDPILTSCLHQNRSLAFLKLGQFDAAAREISRVPELLFARMGVERSTRLERIISAIDRKDTHFPLSNDLYARRSWMYTKYNVNLLTLSFYDFPFSIISHEEILMLHSIEN